MGALIISQRLFGFTTRLGRLVEPGEETLDSTAGIRVLRFDRIMEKYVGEMDQIVLPGAGFDLIALRFTEGKDVKVFELDQVNTLKLKVETLKKAGIKHDWITYIPVDYASESWVDRLVEAGFDRTKKTLFLWQSVSLYLEEGVVKGTLRDMADLCVDGSIVAQDFYSRAYSSGDYSFIAKRNLRLIESMGEPAIFGIDMSDDPKAEVESSVIGPYATIEGGCRILGSIVQNSIVEKNTLIEDVILDRSMIGQNSRIKGGSHSINIGDNTDFEI